MPNKVFFDVNVLLDSALRRAGKQAADRRLHASAGRAHISALTVHLFVYFAQKDIALADLEVFLREFVVLPLEQADINWAFANLHNNDFEDALQLAVAIRHGCDEFMTFDKQLYETYKSLPQLTLTLA